MKTGRIGAKAVARPRAAGLVLPLYLGTIFLSAFLLFSIQPMFAKMVLPRLGGSPGVWSVAMVFFQAVLLAGYAYAHWLSRLDNRRRAALIHLCLMLTVLATALPIGIAGGFEQPPPQAETLWLILLFAASVGLPFFAVSAHGPLLQAWFARSGHERAGDPYFLYAASNFGSFLALLAYPVLIEPLLPSSLQARAWSWGFAFLIGGIAACAGFAVGREPGTRAAEPRVAAGPLPVSLRLSWIGLSFVPSALLIAVTAHISTDVAAAPFLWVVPLALFLATFVVVFQSSPILPHGWMLRAQPVLLVALIAHALFKPPFGWPVALALHLCLFFVTAMVAHGELARRRPEPARLTDFYLHLSLGGVLGGIFAGLLAPLLFNSVAEYPLLLALGLLCRPLGPWHRLAKGVRVTLVALGVAGFGAWVAAEARRTDSVRSFFGVHRIAETGDGRHRMLLHGTTMHGAERLRDAQGNAETGRPEPLTYYFSGGAIAQAIDSVRQARGGRLGRAAAVGVGTGSLACQFAAGEDWRFHEIDAAVIRIARDPARFRFVSACAPEVPFVLGDARLTLAQVPDTTLDLLVVDAFSSDAIPVHLMTREALALYRRKLTPDGVLLIHISNRNMVLGPTLAATAARLGLTTWIRSDRRPDLAAELKFDPEVAVIARSAGGLGPIAADPRWRPQATAEARAWSDDYADLLGPIWLKLTRR